MEQNKISKYFRIGLLIVCAAIEAILCLLWLVTLGATLTGDYGFSYIWLALLLLLDSAFFLAVSSVGIYRCFKNKKFVILPGLGMKVYSVLLFLVLSVVAVDVGSPIPMIVSILPFFVLVALPVFLIYSKKHRKKKTPEDNRFIGFDADKDNAAAENEYRWLWMKDRQALSSADRSAATDYAFIPSAYIVIWMIRHGYVTDRTGSISELAAILQTDMQMNSDPMISLKRFTGCRIMYSDLAPEIIPFAAEYFQMMPTLPVSAAKRMFIFDYYEIVRNKDHRFYCINFSWSIYRQLEQRINDACFSYANNFVPSAYRAPSPEFGSFELVLFGGRVPFRSFTGISFGYINECMTMMNHITPAEIEAFKYQLAAACAVDAGERNKLYYSLRPKMAVVPKPLEKGRACILFCECENGRFSPVLTVRDGMILHVTCAGDETSPWSEINDMRYKLRRSAAETGIAEISNADQLRKAVSEGRLWKVPIDPENDSDSISTTPYAAILKSHCDMMIECLNVRGIRTEYICRPEYANDHGAAKRLYISAAEAKTHDPVFAHIIEVY